MSLVKEINNDNLFPSWWKNKIWTLFKEYFRNKIPLIAISIFFGYWVLPLLIASVGLWIKDNSWNVVKDYIVNIYIGDTTHLVFAVTVSLSGTLCSYTLYQIPKTISSLFNENVLNGDFRQIEDIYNRNRKIANSILPKIVSFFPETNLAVQQEWFYYQLLCLLNLHLPLCL